jgi:exodeoxyribonuclease VII large subunit
VIVLARGGGSLEDLAAFNSERVARAIATSRLPVVSAVGHETDFTIADFVADLRAPTPSAAAELITEAQHRIEELMAMLENRLARAARYQLLRAQQRFARVPAANAQQRVASSLHRLEQRLDDLGFRLEAALGETLRRNHTAVAELSAAVMRHDPRRQLSAAREELATCQSRLDHALDRQISAAQYRRGAAEARLFRAAQVSVAARRSAWTEVRREMLALSPLSVLKRGYAMVQDESGAVVRSVNQLAAGQTVHTRLADGGFSSSVKATRLHNRKKDKPTTR